MASRSRSPRDGAVVDGQVAHDLDRPLAGLVLPPGDLRRAEHDHLDLPRLEDRADQRRVAGLHVRGFLGHRRRPPGHRQVVAVAAVRRGLVRAGSGGGGGDRRPGRQLGRGRRRGGLGRRLGALGRASEQAGRVAGGAGVDPAQPDRQPVGVERGVAVGPGHQAPVARGTGPAATTAAPRAGTVASTTGWSAPGVDDHDGERRPRLAPRRAPVRTGSRAGARAIGWCRPRRPRRSRARRRGRGARPAPERPTRPGRRPAAGRPRRPTGAVATSSATPESQARTTASSPSTLVQAELLDVDEDRAAVVGGPQRHQARGVWRLLGGDAPDLRQVGALEAPLPAGLVGREAGRTLTGGLRQEQLQPVGPGPHAHHGDGRPGRAHGPGEVAHGGVDPVGRLVVGDRPPLALGRLQRGGRHRRRPTPGPAAGPAAAQPVEAPDDARRQDRRDAGHQ